MRYINTFYRGDADKRGETSPERRDKRQKYQRG